MGWAGLGAIVETMSKLNRACAVLCALLFSSFAHMTIDNAIELFGFRYNSRFTHQIIDDPHKLSD